MAHSIEMVGEKVEIIPDGILEIIMSLVIREVRNHPAQYPSFQPVAEGWAEIEEAGGPGYGCIDLGFESVAASAPLRREALSLLYVVRSHLEQAGPELSGTELTALVIRPGEEYGTLPTNVVIGGVEALERLLK